MKNIVQLLAKIPECRKCHQVYVNHRKVQDMIFEEFKKSYIKEDLWEYKLSTFNPIKPRIPLDSYKGITIYEKPLEEVGCGVKCLAQGLTPGYESPSRELFEVLTKDLEKKGYYYNGRGWYWHLFDVFCSRLSHWYDIIEAIEHGFLVTVLIKREGDSRNHFTNLIGTINETAVANNLYTAEIQEGREYSFITSDGEFYSLDELMNMIITAPWKWSN